MTAKPTFKAIKAHLFEVADVVAGTRFPLSVSGMHVKLVGVSNLENLITINTDNAKSQTISKKTYQTIKLRKIKKNDILTSLVGNNIGTLAIATKNLDCFASSDLAILRPVGIQPEYLLSVLNSKKTKKLLSKLATGTAQKRLSLISLRENVEIPLLSNSEQLKVVKKFNVLKNNISKIETNLEKAKKDLDNFTI